jgi:hypothetical protein
MRFYPETELRNKTDMPTIKMLDLWHEECRKRLESDIPVQIADRKENPRFKDFDSPFSTATPQELENKLCLVLWLESMEPLDCLLVTHELGHFVLALQGFKCLIDSYSPSGEIGGMLNSFAQHPPLFVLQRALGHEPQQMIDAKVRYDISIYEGMNRLPDEYYIRDGLLVADDLNNCSPDEKQRLIQAVSRKYPKIYNVARIVLESLQYYVLNNPKENFKLLRNLRKVLKLGSSWVELDYAAKLSAGNHLEII